MLGARFFCKSQKTTFFIVKQLNHASKTDDSENIDEVFDPVLQTGKTLSFKWKGKF